MFKMHSGFDLLHYVLFFAKTLVKNTNFYSKLLSYERDYKQRLLRLKIIVFIGFAGFRKVNDIVLKM